MEDFASENDTSCYVLLMKDRKPICRAQCINPPFKLSSSWSITYMAREQNLCLPLGLPRCTLFRAPENSSQEKEWVKFSAFLQQHRRVAVGEFDHYRFHILPPDEGSAFSHLTVSFLKLDQPATRSLVAMGEDTLSNSNMSEVGVTTENNRDRSAEVQIRSGLGNAVGVLARNPANVNPTFLKTLSQNHSSWIFGAIAELVDNSRDAKATNLLISVEMIHYKPAGMDIQHIPMLSVMDNGHGMNHQELVRMLSLGHNQPNGDTPDRIGRFGVGFKTGAMRIGKDALVLTQTSNSRSIAFLSQSMNEGKDFLEIPIVSFCRVGKFIEIDASVQDEAAAKANLKAIKDFSPFDKFLIGEKAALFDEQGTGTQIYIWNLDKWGSNYSLRWETEMTGGSSSHQSDIMIESKRVRSRPGQISKEVPLDYSLKSYLEVIFLDPRMKIRVQGAQIKSRPLAKSLHQTVVINGTVMGRKVKLILGRSQVEWERANCGIFIYWHGRLIEAYKRVGSMIHNGDMGRGIIGVIDLTNLMEQKDNDPIWVHNNKQGFQDCETYAELERWLGVKADAYLDKYVNMVRVKIGNASLKPDCEWVQCDKCRKWRMLRAGFDSSTLPAEWFCYMKPFTGRCEIPEEETEDFVTISAKRSGYNCTEDSDNGRRSNHQEDAWSSKKKKKEDSENDRRSNYKETAWSSKKKKEDSENDWRSNYQEAAWSSKKKEGDSSDSSQSWSSKIKKVDNADSSQGWGGSSTYSTRRKGSKPWKKW